MGEHGHGTSAGSMVLHSARAYDVLVWVLTLGRERRFRDHLVDLARVASGESVLDVGCGTGGLAMAAKGRAGATGRVCGIDPSPEMVARARHKAARAGVGIGFEEASIEALPFPDATFDAVLSCLMLHHLSDDGRRHGVADVARVLRPGGRFLAVDLGATAGKRKALLFNRLARHADFDLDAQTPVLEEAGLRAVESGPVGSPRILGLSNLRYILAAKA